MSCTGWTSRPLKGSTTTGVTPTWTTLPVRGSMRYTEDTCHEDEQQLMNKTWPHCVSPQQNFISKCLESKEATITKLNDDGERLINADHPGKNVIEVKTLLLAPVWLFLSKNIWASLIGPRIFTSWFHSDWDAGDPVQKMIIDAFGMSWNLNDYTLFYINKHWVKYLNV